LLTPKPLGRPATTTHEEPQVAQLQQQVRELQQRVTEAELRARLAEGGVSQPSLPRRKKGAPR
jgi:hypothetical protein